MIYKCIFYIGDEINVYQYVDNKFVCLKYKGENSYFGNKEDLFSWFEEKIGYIFGQSLLDLCILSDREFSFEFNNYNFVDKSSWTSNEIKRFLFDVKYIERAILKFNDEEFSIIQNNLDIFKIINLDLYFYPNNEGINFLEKEIGYEINTHIDKHIENNIQVSEDKKQSILARYYRERTNKINNL